MLRIEYNSDDQSAVIRSDKSVSDLAWAEVRRVCLDRSKYATSPSARIITIPWWHFLVIRADLSYVLDKHDITPEFSEGVRNYLIRAREHEEIFENAVPPKRLARNELQKQLSVIGFRRKLTPQQARNVSRILMIPAAATFSVPGAGKTTEALAYFFLKREEDSKLLVVAPKNAFAAWEEQLSECLPNSDHRIVRLQGGLSGVEEALRLNPTIALITYQQLYRVVPQVAAFLSSYPCFMFLDESHRMKRGYSGVYGSTILGLSHLPISKLILSGTPMPNSDSDLVPQFNFLYPEIQVTNESVIQLIQNIYVRTTKDELGLKEPYRIEHPVQMKDAQRRLYEMFRSEAARQIANLSITDRIRLRAFGKSVMRLMQVTTEPALLASSSLSSSSLLHDALNEGQSNKIIEACRIARELASQGKKCIIWSQFVQIVETIADQLTDLGAEYIHGGVETDDDEENTDSREAIIRRFHNDPNCMVLVANPAAASEGISLHTICHHAIYVDRNYNAAQYLQSEDRIHRLGLKPDQNTYITVLHSPNSIDESIHRRLSTKVNRMRRVLNDPSLNIEPVRFDEEIGFDNEDLEDIRRLLRA